MNRAKLENQFNAYYNDLTRITNKYIEHQGEIDWEDFLESLRKSPGVIDATVENTNDHREDANRAWYKKLDEPSYSRLKIVLERRGGESNWGYDAHISKMYGACRIKFYGLINMIAEDYGCNIVSRLISKCPQREWTKEYIVEYYEWSNHYGS
jgi:hypothetical protein